MTAISTRHARTDIAQAFQRYHLALTFGWQDVAQRYRRSRLGAFWLTINMGVLIGALGIIFGTLFRAPIVEFLPYVCAGLIVWGFISTSIIEGGLSFIAAEGIILQARMPLFTHILRTLWRNFIILLHNFAILPIVFLVFMRAPSWHALLAVPGLILVVANLMWIMLVLGIICARYRDMNQIIQNLIQVAFYATPLMWMPQTLPDSVSHIILDFNPFYHLVSIVRAPLLGEYPSGTSWLFALASGVVGWAVAIAFYGRYRARIPYWL